MVKSRLFFHSVSLFLTIVISVTPILGKGFCADTLVKTVAGYQPIEYIRPGEQVVCYDTYEEHAVTGTVQAVVQKKVNEVIWIDVGSTWIKAACDQQFYTTDGWCRADALLMGDCLVCDGTCHLVESVLHVQTEQPCMVYDLSIPPYHTFHVSEYDIVAHNVAVVFPLGAALLETKTLCSIGIFIGCCFFQYKTGIKVEGEIDATCGGTSNSSASRSQASPAISSSAGSSNFDNDGSYSGGGLESQAVRVRAVKTEKPEDSFSSSTGTYDYETELIERSRNPTAPKGCHTGPRPQSFYVPDDSADSQGQVCNDMSGDSSDEVGSSNKNGGDKNEKCICGHKCLTSNCQCTCSCPCGVKNLEKRKANKPKKRDRKKQQKKQQSELPDATKTPPIEFTEEAIEEAVKHGTTERKIHHIFENEMHNLGQLIEKVGSKEGVIRAVVTALSGKVGEGKFSDVAVEVAGFFVYVRGRVMEGVVKIGTFFIK